MKKNLPETFEEYALLNGWGPSELDYEESAEGKRQYEKLASIINKIEPFSEEEIASIGTGVLMQRIDKAEDLGHMAEDVYFDLIDFVEEEEIALQNGFICDILDDFFVVKYGEREREMFNLNTE